MKASLLSVIGSAAVFCMVIWIQFRSEIVHNLKDVQTEFSSLSDRVAIFVVDGMRKSTFIGENQDGLPRARHVLNRVCEEGLFGTVDVATPTESRPCHVSMFAGFREDPANLFSAWKANVEPFDSVFNRSDECLLFGSVDIIELFDRPQHCRSFTYDLLYPKRGWEKSYLDTWVLRKAKDFFKQYEPRNNRRQIFFFHLMGSDTNGHTHGAVSAEYENNVVVADSVISQIEDLFIEKFGSGSTSFIVTSDHGHVDQGGHGGSDREASESPFAAWGPAFKKMKPNTCSFGALDAHRLRIEQKNIAPLVSAVLGNQPPSNSRSLLRLDLLNTTTENSKQLMLNNLEQLTTLSKWTNFDYETRKYDSISKLISSQRQVANGIIMYFWLSKLFVSLLVSFTFLYVLSSVGPLQSQRKDFVPYLRFVGISCAIIVDRRFFFLPFIATSSTLFSKLSVKNCTACLRFVGTIALVISLVLERSNFWLDFFVLLTYFSPDKSQLKLHALILNYKHSRQVALPGFLTFIACLTRTFEESGHQVSDSFKTGLSVIIIFSFLTLVLFYKTWIACCGQFLLGLSFLILNGAHVKFYIFLALILFDHDEHEKLGSIQLAGNFLSFSLSSFFAINKLESVHKENVVQFHTPNYWFAFVGQTLCYIFLVIKLFALRFSGKKDSIVIHTNRLSAILSVVFMICIKSHGSWLEVGQSIFRFAISIFTGPLVSALFQAL